MSLETKLNEWHRCNEKRLALGREAETFKKRCEQLEDEFRVELEKSGKSSVIRAGYTLCWTPSRTYVAWADEFLKEVGPERTAELKSLAASECKRTLSIVAPMTDG